MTAASAAASPELQKCPTGIQGLDEITAGGLPRGRPTLVCGDAGSGKTILAMQFLARGITEFDEPGVFVAFEENSQDLALNMASMGVDVQRLCADNRLAIDWVHVDAADIEEAGEYDLEGLFIRVQCAVQRVQARRIVLDSIEALFSSLQDESVLRSELQRLFRWIKEQQLTAIVTGERGDGRLTRHGLEEYVADCVICGSVHGANQYPFLIGKNGFSVFPITSVGLECAASTEHISSVIAQLYAMLRGGGFFRGSTILVSGGAGAGKTSVAAHFVRAGCERGERVLYFAFEESREQIIRNMRSIGIDLAPWMERGLLQFHAARPSLCGLETHLAMILAAVEEFKPRAIVLDPLSDFLVVGSSSEVKGMLTRLIDFLKLKEITALFTSLTTAEHSVEQSEAGISSLIDTWLLLRNLEQNGERNRVLYLLKSRGMAHSTQVREFLLTDHGVELVDVCVSAGGVLTGSARREHEARLAEDALRQKEEGERKRLQLERRRREMETQMENLRRQFEEEEREVAESMEKVTEITTRARADRAAITRARQQSGGGNAA